MTEKLRESHEPLRNDPCWCGSGKKYKKCHWKRENAKSIPVSRVLQIMRKAISQKMCLHPKANEGECRGNIVKAHTVQRASLSKIAENGHVYAFQGDAALFQPGSGKIHSIVPQKVGIQKASTFTGFCGKHDNDTFRAIEEHRFKFCPEHAFLLGYRALCRELFAKKAILRMKDLYRDADRGKPLGAQIQIQRFAGAFIAGTQAGHDDMQKIKTEYDRILERRDFSQVRYYTVLFDEYPDILCSGGFWPEYDFTGRKVQEPLAENPEAIHFSLITTEQAGAAIFTWLERKGISEEFIKSLDLISNVDLPHAITRFIFEYFENTYLRPSWWENLSGDVRRQLHHRMAMLDSVLVEHQPRCLIDDGLRTVNWRVVARKTNCPAFGV